MDHPKPASVRIRRWGGVKLAILVLGFLAGSPPPGLAADPAEADRSEDQAQSSQLDEELSRIAAFSTDHTLTSGDWLVGYEFMHSRMKGNRIGTKKISTSEFFDRTSFMVQPRWMTMDMHMLHVMYAATDALTFMLMVPFIDMEMGHVTRMGGTFQTQSRGFGDTEILAHYTAYDRDWKRVIPRFGLRIPTGSVDETDLTPAGQVRLPYPMQLGSGTWDFEIGATAILETEGWNFGADVEGILRSGKNKHDYRLGHEAAVEGWVQRPITSWLALSAGSRFLHWGNIRGQDPAQNPALVPTAAPNLQGGKRLDFFGQATVLARTGLLKGQRLYVEVGHPAYEDLDGPQLSTGVQIEVNWAYTF